MDASVATPRIVPFGDSAWLVVFGEVVDPTLSARAHALVAAIEAERMSGATGDGATQAPPWGAPVPAYASVLVPFDPLTSEAGEVVDRLRRLVESSAEASDDGPRTAGPAAELVEIDVRYGGDDGPDLADVAHTLGMTEAEVIAEHTAGRYVVYFLGFVPGFGYLGPLSPRLRLPRRASPRTRVPAGSVAIAGTHTGVYPLATPGGWHLIGRTDAELWRVDRDPPSLLRAGQEIRFRALDGG